MNAYNGFPSEQRNKAQAWLNKQWKAGTLSRPTVCCACTQSKGVMHAHAEDYSEPFEAGKTDQYHLCYRCHMIIHCRKYNMVEWNQYRDLLRLGYSFVEPISSFPAFIQWLKDAELWVPTKVRKEQTTTPLDDIHG